MSGHLTSLVAELKSLAYELNQLREHVTNLESLAENARSVSCTPPELQDLLTHCERTGERPTVEAIHAACKGLPVDRCLHEMAS